MGKRAEASIHCNVRAHNPHIGTRGTVKAKANGDCTLIPTGLGLMPPEEDVTWTPRMILLKYWRIVPVAVAANKFIKRGHDVEWHQNSPSGRGTQVDSGKCRNGIYMNSVEINIHLPRGFRATQYILAAENTSKTAITGCSSSSSIPSNPGRDSEDGEEDLPTNDRILP